jgi:hypothetical protein
MDTLLSTTRTLFSKSSLNSLLAKKPLKPRSFTRPSLLFIPGSSSLAHLGRLLTLAQTLPSDIGDIHFACDSYLRHYVPKPFCWQPAGSLSGDEMRQRLKRGQTLLDEDSVRHQVEEDLALLRSVQPTVVVGDFRPSLSISAALAKVPYVNVVNAHWSPWANILFESAGALDAWWARPWGPRLGKRLTDVMLPLGLRIQARPFNRVRRSYGLPPLTNDLRHIYTAGDVVAYTDLEGWVPTPGAPRMHRHIGPVLWEPPMDLPAWWNTVKTDRPLRLCQCWKHRPMGHVQRGGGSPAPPPGRGLSRHVRSRTYRTCSGTYLRGGLPTGGSGVQTVGFGDLQRWSRSRLPVAPIRRACVGDRFQRRPDAGHENSSRSATGPTSSGGALRGNGLGQNHHLPAKLHRIKKPHTSGGSTFKPHVQFRRVSPAPERRH